ncbi:hypothetical protein [Carboxylicivirga sp. M1479]|uniref:hypothetical protein n=1 Tax=Carboxylicivirga sp. M1479 TaxID=2594476 RepID=UPI001178639E|nr:hypothetical protein [Carboxylicivirga sp. M1479]TRX66403.1 hypothetical protein FNN09_13635 [Carboxylicivirga sp. M1479]
MDKYSLHARIYPVVIFLLPIVILGITYSIKYEEYFQILTTLGVSSALVYMMSNIGRDKGKKKENKLWQGWGGMPTIQLLHFRDNTIDDITKRKYHNKLLKFDPIEKEDVDFENTSLVNLSEIYQSWTKFLISQTRDTKKYALLFKENMSYGFRRNLWGLKTISLIFISIALLINYVFAGLNVGFLCFNMFSSSFWISEIALLLLMCIWLFVITSSWIKIPAYGYAERLLESIETL